MLGMMAMIPENVDLIARQIDQYFYYNNSPRYIPCGEHHAWYAMDRDGKFSIS